MPTPQQYLEVLDEHLVRLDNASNEELRMRLTSAVAIGKELVRTNAELNENLTGVQNRCTTLLEEMRSLRRAQ